MCWCIRSRMFVLSKEKSMNSVEARRNVVHVCHATNLAFSRGTA